MVFSIYMTGWQARVTTISDTLVVCLLYVRACDLHMS